LPIPGPKLLGLQLAVRARLINDSWQLFRQEFDGGIDGQTQIVSPIPLLSDFQRCTDLIGSHGKVGARISDLTS
jgi:hypothetical protein